MKKDESSSTTFLLEIVLDIDGRSKIHLTPPPMLSDKLDAQRAAREQGQQHLVPSKEDELASRLRRLSDEWTALAVGFFETVPIMSALNFMIAQGDLSERVIAYAKEKSEKTIEVVNEEGQRLYEFQLHLDEMPVIAKKLGKSTQSLRTAGALGRAALAALVSEYEAFMARLIHILAEIRPAAVISDDDTISLKDLQGYSTIEQAREAMLESKIEEILHEKSHTEMLKWLEDKFGVNLTSDRAVVADFIEVCQRRHILMHAGGVVSRRYARICREAGLKDENLPKVGDTIEVSRKYLRRATTRVFLVGFCTLHIVWQKLLPKQTERSVQAILESSHDFLESDLTKTARRVCDFLLTSKTKVPDRLQAYLIINRAQSFLFDCGLTEEERQEGVNNSLKLRDWTMISPVVELALACLRKDFSSLEELSKRAIEAGLGYHQAQVWNIFREIRDDPRFTKNFPVGKRDTRPSQPTLIDVTGDGARGIKVPTRAPRARSTPKDRS
ncbi:hypothetical protein MASR1M32_16870 [Rhodobacter sp.]